LGREAGVTKLEITKIVAAYVDAHRAANRKKYPGKEA
jgi:hypothetical protein